MIAELFWLFLSFLKNIYFWFSHHWDWGEFGPEQLNSRKPFNNWDDGVCGLIGNDLCCFLAWNTNKKMAELIHLLASRWQVLCLIVPVKKMQDIVFECFQKSLYSCKLSMFTFLFWFHVCTIKDCGLLQKIIMTINLYNM